MKNKRKIIWLAPALIIILLFATNPSESGFREFLKEKAKAGNKDKDPVEALINEIVSGTSARIFGLSTNRKEYYLFSTYKVGLTGDKKLYLGCLNHFVLLEKSNSE